MFFGLYLINSDSIPKAAPPAPNIPMLVGTRKLKSSFREVQKPIPSVLVPIIFLPLYKLYLQPLLILLIHQFHQGHQ